MVPAPDTANLERLAAALSRLDAVVDGADELTAGELPDPLDPAAPGRGGNWLLRLKELAGRPEDLADLERLREAREE